MTFVSEPVFVHFPSYSSLDFAVTTRQRLNRYLTYTMGVGPLPGGARLRAATIHKELLRILLALSTAFMIWKALVLITSATVPVVVVVSESMAPAFHRGDLLLLWNRQQAINVGDIPVVWFPGNKLPMVHRAVQVHWTESATMEAR